MILIQKIRGYGGFWCFRSNCTKLITARKKARGASDQHLSRRLASCEHFVPPSIHSLGPLLGRKSLRDHGRRVQLRELSFGRVRSLSDPPEKSPTHGFCRRPCKRSSRIHAAQQIRPRPIPSPATHHRKSPSQSFSERRTTLDPDQMVAADDLLLTYQLFRLCKADRVRTPPSPPFQVSVRAPSMAIRMRRRRRFESEARQSGLECLRVPLMVSRFGIRDNALTHHSDLIEDVRTSVFQQGIQWLRVVPLHKVYEVVVVGV
eukprot:SAG31_NODE_6701_length_1919_cov_1.388462_4_plen_261_part_00